MKQVDSKTHTKRLLKLANILEKLSRNKLNMRTWGSHAANKGHRPTEKNYCGTQACALGWAALDPGFQKEGLRAEWSDTPEGGRLYLIISDTYGRIEERAGAAFFGLSMQEAYDLFLGTRQTRGEVIKHLRRLAIKREELGNVPVLTPEAE
jgi:hypothetical protein